MAVIHQPLKAYLHSSHDQPTSPKVNGTAPILHQFPRIRGATISSIVVLESIIPTNTTFTLVAQMV